MKEFSLPIALSVFLGGGLGSLLRYFLSLNYNERFLSVLHGIPLGTLLANLLGCFILGYLSGLSSLSLPLKLGLTTGLMGGLTTFSTFSIENVRLISEGQTLKSIIHIGLHVGFGIALGLLGLSLALVYAKK